MSHFNWFWYLNNVEYNIALPGAVLSNPLVIICLNQSRIIFKSKENEKN